MTETTADNRPDPLDPDPRAPGSTDTEPLHPGPADTERTDPLDRIAAELDELGALDPAEAVPVLADVTAELSRELDADSDRS